MAIFAIYNDASKGLYFYDRSTTPTVGSTFDGKVVTALYTNFANSIIALNSQIPWYKDGTYTNIKQAIVVDVISPTKYIAFWFSGCSSIETIDLSRMNTSNVTSMSYMFDGCSSLTSLNLSNFDTSNVTSMHFMFRNCSSLTSLNLSNFDTSKVTGMQYMFNSCSSLTSLDLSNFDTSKVTNMNNMFFRCYALTSLDVSNFDTSKVTNMQFMFGDCYALTSLDVSNFDTSSVTNMAYMFQGCRVLTSLDVSNFDTSNVTSMFSMFHTCYALTSLDLGNFDTSNVTEMSAMFMGCRALTSLDLSSFDTSNVTRTYGMFSTCYALTSLDLSNFDTSNVTEMKEMFNECSSLQTIYASQFWRTNLVTISANMFKNCTSLVGDMPFQSEYTDKTYATYEGGYLTYKANNAPKDYLIKGFDLLKTANAIREKTGSTNTIKPKDFPAAIAAIPSGSGLSVVGTYFTGDVNSSSSKYYWGIYDWYSSIAGNCIDLSKCELGKTYMHLEFKNGSYYDYNLHCMYPDGSNTTYLADMKLYDKNGNEGAGSSNFLQYGIMYYKFRVEKGTITNGYDVYDADTGSKICTNAIRLYGAVGHSMAFLLD